MGGVGVGCGWLSAWQLSRYSWCVSGYLTSIFIDWFHRLATPASGEYKAVRKPATISGSGYDQYLYSPRPKPWRAMIIVLRKMSSRSYIAASERHSSRVRTDLTMVQPKLSKSLVIAAQSRRQCDLEWKGLLWSRRHPFPCQECLLAIHTPTIAGDVSVVTKDSVAGNGHRKCVCTAGLCDGPC